MVKCLWLSDWGVGAEAVERLGLGEGSEWVELGYFLDRSHDGS